MVRKPKRKIIPYNERLVPLARELRNNMTYGEIALWREIKGKKLGLRFSRQIPIDEYIVDFFCKDLLLAIEVDGSIHFEEGHEEKDIKRQTRLESLGVHVLRFSDLDVKNNLNWVLDTIENYMENLKPTPNPSQEGNGFV
jgi:very-short-patch-repair endonuclease